MLDLKSAAKSDRMYWVALLMEALAFHRHVLFYSGYVFPWDFRGSHVPWATFAADTLRGGHFPLWDPYTYCGNPIFENIQAALFYPPVFAATLAGVWLGDGFIPRLLAIAVVAQVVFAGICTYVLAKRLGASPAAAWIAATVYELGCYFAAQAEHMGCMHGASWLPLAWLAVIALRAGLKFRWLGALSLALAMTILAGFPQCAVAAFGSTLGLAVIIAAFRLARWKLPLLVLIGWAWALLLAAIQFIPTSQLLTNSVAKYRVDWLKSGGGMHPGALWTLVAPNYWSVFDLSKFHGPGDLTFLYLYSSLAGLALALAAMLWKPDRWRAAFTVFIVVAALAMFGDTTPIGRNVLGVLPVSIRIGIHPEYTFCNFSLALALLAGLGAQKFLRNTRVQVIAGTVIACDLILVSSGRPMNSQSVKEVPGITHDSADGDFEIVRRLRALAGATTPPARFDMSANVSYSWSEMGQVLQIPTANGCDPMAPERVMQVRLALAPGERWGTCYQVVNRSSAVLGLANVRYLLDVEKGRYTIEENPRALPRFFFGSRVKLVNGLAEAANVVRAPDFNPADVAVVEAQDKSLDDVGNAKGRVEVISYEASSVSLRTQTTKPALLVAADTYYPGWEVRVDGQQVRLYAADVAFRAVRIPAGDHRIEMRFIPRILYRSASISGTALLALAVVLAGGTRRHAAKWFSPAAR